MCNYETVKEKLSSRQLRAGKKDWVAEINLRIKSIEMATEVGI